MRIGNEMRTDYTANFKPLEAAKEFASNKGDSITPENTESISSKVKRWFCCIPLGVLTVIKKVIYLLSCCILFSDKVDQKALIAGLEPVLEAWEKRGASKEEKEAAWDTFAKAYPYQKEQILAIFVENKRTAELVKDSLKPEKVNAWNAKYLEKVKKDAEERFKNFDTILLGTYRSYLQDLVDENK